jgi:hypothetical protein
LADGGHGRIIKVVEHTDDNGQIEIVRPELHTAHVAHSEAASGSVALARRRDVGLTDVESDVMHRRQVREELACSAAHVEHAESRTWTRILADDQPIRPAFTDELLRGVVPRRRGEGLLQATPKHDR